jgi:MerR family transcriptional regulator, thiopeptide resistance regulator
MADTVYRVHEFAERAGVTVRALHHYDRLGLLTPARRSEGGYRLYTDRDLARLEQIVVLKFLGLPLKEIGRVLRDQASLPEALRTQVRVLGDRRRQLDQAIFAIAEAERSLRANGEPDSTLLRQIIKEIEMQTNNEWTRQYYSDEAKAKVEERKKLWTPELQAEVSKAWADLCADVEAALKDDEDPAAPRAQALAARWRKLLEGFTGGDPEIQRGLNRMWADQQNWPADARQKYAINPEIQDFIMRAFQAGAAKA